MKDGLQNISFDRILMRLKDITSIGCNLITMLTAIITALWISFKFIDSQNRQQQMINDLVKMQIENAAKRK
jgi:hypothetical protein